MSNSTERKVRKMAKDISNQVSDQFHDTFNGNSLFAWVFATCIIICTAVYIYHLYIEMNGISCSPSTGRV